MPEIFRKKAGMLLQRERLKCFYGRKELTNTALKEYIFIVVLTKRKACATDIENGRDRTFGYGNEK